ncbi:MAG: hypothetical protein AAF846_27085 [Chloroflexota bacterium]
MTPPEIDLESLRVFRFVRDYHRQHGMPPSQREIGTGTFMAPATVMQHVARLEAKGWLTREYKIPRSIRLSDLAPTDSQFDSLWDEFIALIDAQNASELD